MDEKLRVVVVGAGAVGAYFGGRLAQSGKFDAAVICRNNLDLIKRNAYSVRSIAGDFKFVPAACYQNPGDCEWAADIVLIASKVLPEINTCEIIRPLIKSNTAIMLIQNGIDIEGKIHRAYPDNELISAIAYIGVTRGAGANLINHTGGGTLKFGHYESEKFSSRKIELLQEAFNATGVKSEIVEDIIQYRYIKEIWNVPYNSISVLAGGVDTYFMSHDQRTCCLAYDIMKEIQSIAKADGRIIGDDVIESTVDYTRNFPPYKTSMLIDDENHRPLESEAIVGNLLRIGEKYNVSTPNIRCIYALLRSVNIHIK